MAPGKGFRRPEDPLMRPETPVPPHPCPDAAHLRAFDAGKLESKELEPIAAHLAECESCRQRLRNLGDASAIRSESRSSAPALSPFVEEPECRRLEAMVKALVVAPSGDPTIAPDAMSD